MNPDQTLPSKIRSENTYQAILNAIREGVYRPGDPLREEEVAARIGVSRTPVREALGRLQEKGLVEAATGRGVAVTVLTMAQIFELYAMREEMEAIVARIAAHQATEIEICDLERINEELRVAQTPAEAANLNRQFHSRLYDATRNRYLSQAVEGLEEAIALFPASTFVQEGRAVIAAEEHARLVAAIRRHDASAAQSLAIHHIREALRVRLIVTAVNG